MQAECPWCGAEILTAPGEPIECYSCPYTPERDREMDGLAAEMDKWYQVVEQNGADE